MIGEVNHVALSMSLRYKIISIEGDNYIIDMDRPLWGLIFPFGRWMMPHAIYKINNINTIEEIKAPTVQQMKTSHVNIFGAGISVLLANLLRPFMDYFEIEINAFVNNLILTAAFMLIFLLRITISKVNNKNLQKIVNINGLEKKKMWIYPQSLKFVFQYIFFYLFFLVFLLFGIYGFVKEQNIIMLLIGMMFTFAILIANLITILPGRIQVKLKIE